MTSGHPNTVPPAWLAALPAGCTARPLEGARWGQLLMPPALPPSAAPQGQLRLVLFASFWIGQATLQAALAYQRRFPERLRIVGLVTDDPVSPQARISLRKRAWSIMPPAERLQVKLGLLRTALAAGIPVYTGEIKTPGFRQALGQWRPDALVTCGFGQVLDRPILDALPYGAYNCHPTDLANGHGAGPSPWDDMVTRGVFHTVWSVHRMIEQVDAGPVIGQSPPIHVGDASGRLIADARCFFYKVVPGVAPMILRLVDSLAARRGTGRPGLLQAIDIPGAVSPALRARLAAPVAIGWQDLTIPVPGEADFAALHPPMVEDMAAAG
ncbi:formyltransferase family protein [Paracraurococcus ruber]|uniref:Formyl transferase N-terminal domain-containing protein n=1 Tax=Paracraurococcus ruber TaxID=77675 RepID=A0ABS1CX57_9PROT|nr:formyltransferase family protein [Paracraurococcus ruber]MBK1659115.1 hypothetical protein [Paracraurococcus ruber]TDG29154.1 hypothetical protein E2C05_18660 [Paracraurococcus ruber]